jgi:hypothetical protein
MSRRVSLSSTLSFAELKFILSILCGTLPAGRQVCDSSASLCEKIKAPFKSALVRREAKKEISNVSNDSGR